MNEVRLTFSDRSFLLRVQRGEIKKSTGYSARRGSYTKFYGGEKTFIRLRHAGLVTMLDAPSLGRPAIAILTEAGLAALGASS